MKKFLIALSMVLLGGLMNMLPANACDSQCEDFCVVRAVKAAVSVPVKVIKVGIKLTKATIGTGAVLVKTALQTPEIFMYELDELK